VEKKQSLLKDEEKKRADFKAGRQVGVTHRQSRTRIIPNREKSSNLVYFPQLSGREMFTFNPAMATESDELEDGDDTFDTRNLPIDEDENAVDVIHDKVKVSLNSIIASYL